MSGNSIETKAWWPLAIGLTFALNPWLALHANVAHATSTAHIFAALVSWNRKERDQFVTAPAEKKFGLNFDDAWERVRDFAEDENIELRGVPAIRESRGGAPLQFFGQGGSALIPAAEITALVRRTIEFEEMLGPPQDGLSGRPPLMGKFWRRVMINKADLTRCLAPTRAKRGGGRPRSYGPTVFVGLLVELFGLHSTIGPDAPDWNSQSKVEFKLAEMFAQRYPKDRLPGDTWLKKFVSAYLDDHPECYPGRRSRKET